MAKHPIRTFFSRPASANSCRICASAKRLAKLLLRLVASCVDDGDLRFPVDLVWLRGNRHHHDFLIALLQLQQGTISRIVCGGLVAWSFESEVVNTAVTMEPFGKVMRMPPLPDWAPG